MDIAKPRYTSRLQDIWEAVMEDEAENAAVSADAEAGLLRHVMPARPNATLKLMRKDGRKVRLFRGVRLPCYIQQLLLWPVCTFAVKHMPMRLIPEVFLPISHKICCLCRHVMCETYKIAMLAM